jgi:hypothetical protein
MTGQKNRVVVLAFGKAEQPVHICRNIRTRKLHLGNRAAHSIDKLTMILEVIIEIVRSIAELRHSSQLVIFIADLKTEQAVSHDLRHLRGLVPRTLRRA